MLVKVAVLELVKADEIELYLFLLERILLQIDLLVVLL